MTNKETYLGDGLYASFDGYQIALRAPREDGDHTVFLEPQVLNNFIMFIGVISGFVAKDELNDG